MSVLSIFGLTKKKNPPLSFYFVFSENIQHQFWTCGTLIYTIALHHQILSKATTNFTSKNKAPSNYLSVLEIHKIILAISTISTPIIQAIINTNFTSKNHMAAQIIAHNLSIAHDNPSIPEQNTNIEEEGRGSRGGFTGRQLDGGDALNGVGGGGGL